MTTFIMTTTNFRLGLLAISLFLWSFTRVEAQKQDSVFYLNIENTKYKLKKNHLHIKYSEAADSNAVMLKNYTIYGSLKSFTDSTVTVNAEYIQKETFNNDVLIENRITRYEFAPTQPSLAVQNNLVTQMVNHRRTNEHKIMPAFWVGFVGLAGFTVASAIVPESKIPGLGIRYSLLFSGTVLVAEGIRNGKRKFENLKAKPWHFSTK